MLCRSIADEIRITAIAGFFVVLVVNFISSFTVGGFGPDRKTSKDVEQVLFGVFFGIQTAPLAMDDRCL
jgi:hypothetical protein